jgi:hypothetical protein
MNTNEGVTMKSKLFAILAMMGFLTLLSVGTVHADPTVVEYPAGTSTTVPADASLVLLVSAAIALFIPLLVDLVTSRLTSGKVKTFLTLVLTAVTGVLTEFLSSLKAGLFFDWKVSAFAAIGSLITALSAFTAWKGAGISGSSGKIQLRFPNGLGKDDPSTPKPHGPEEAFTDGTIPEPAVGSNVGSSVTALFHMNPSTSAIKDDLPPVQALRTGDRKLPDLPVIN